MVKKYISIICYVVAVFALITFIALHNVKVISTGEVSIKQETTFNFAYVKLTNEDMSKLGFAFGDSCNVKFSNGLTFEDIPYYNGYYVEDGEPLICGYTSYPYIAITKNNTSNFWGDNNLSENVTVEITLNQKGKYLEEQETFNMSYSKEQGAEESDAHFANFREVAAGGCIKAGTLYRGASPFDNSNNRCASVERLITQNNISFILDLADSEQDISFDRANNADVNAFCEANLDSNQMAISLLKLNSNYKGEDYKAKLVSGLVAMSKHDGPYYVHCTEGKDRTGFVCFILESLCGASYEDMKNEYMITYSNYYGIESGSNKYDAVVNLFFNKFCIYITNDETNFKNADYTTCAKNYLESAGITQADITALYTKLHN